MTVFLAGNCANVPAKLKNDEDEEEKGLGDEDDDDEVGEIQVAMEVVEEEQDQTETNEKDKKILNAECCRNDSDDNTEKKIRTQDYYEQSDTANICDSGDGSIFERQASHQFWFIKK